jgi:hypothetical protein
MSPPAEHSESEILLVALDVLVLLVDFLDSRDTSLLNEFEGFLDSVSRETNGQD